MAAAPSIHPDSRRQHADQSRGPEPHRRRRAVCLDKAARDHGRGARPARFRRGHDQGRRRGALPFRSVRHQRQPAAADADGARPRGVRRRRAGGRGSRRPRGRRSRGHRVRAELRSLRPVRRGSTGVVRAGRGGQRRRHVVVGGASAASRRRDPESSPRLLGFRRVRDRLAALARQDRQVDSARTRGAVRMRGADRRRRGRQHRAGQARRVGRRDRTRRRGSGCAARRARGGRTARRGCRPLGRQARPGARARGDAYGQRELADRGRRDQGGHPRRRRVRVRVRRCRSRAGARVSHHAAGRDDRHRRAAAARQDDAAIGRQPRGRGAHVEGQLHRHLRPRRATSRAISSCTCRDGCPSTSCCRGGSRSTTSTKASIVCTTARR